MNDDVRTYGLQKRMAVRQEGPHVRKFTSRNKPHHSSANLRLANLTEHTHWCELSQFLIVSLRSEYCVTYHSLPGPM